MEKESSRSLGADLVIPGLALAFAAYFFVSIEGLPWVAKANGVLIGGALAILCVLQVARTARAIFKSKGRAGFASLVAPREIFVKRVAMVGIAAAFILAMPWLGVTLALFLAMFVALYVMGVRRPLPLVLAPLACSAAVYAMFIVVLDAELPRGPIEHLLRSIF